MSVQSLIHYGCVSPLKVWVSKCFRGTGNHPRPTPTSHLQNSLNIQPIPVLIHRLTDEFFAHCPLHSNLLVQQTGNYTLAEVTSGPGSVVGIAIGYGLDGPGI